MLSISNVDKKISYIYLKFYAIAMILFIGFRYKVGGDWYSYLFLFDVIKDLSFFQSLLITDPGYGFINWLSDLLNYDIYFVNFICAIIFVYGLTSLCLALPSPWLAMIVSLPYLVTVVAMGYSRQAVAIGFVMLAFASILNKNYKKFIIMILLASLFHKTAIFLFLFYPMARNKINITKLLLTYGVLFLIVFSLLFDKLIGMWGLYVEQGMESGGSLIRILINMIPAIFFLVFHKRWKTKYPNSYLFILSLSICSVIFFPLQFVLSTTIDRLALYFIPMQMIIFSMGIFLLHETYRILMLMAVIVLYTIMYIYWLHFSFYANCCWIPYNNIIFN
ncbi:EpsG family protein [Photobacterium damselae]|nr:EpsG family protein [Photobacterium damselae]